MYTILIDINAIVLREKNNKICDLTCFIIDYIITSFCSGTRPKTE